MSYLTPDFFWLVRVNFNLHWSEHASHRLSRYSNVSTKQKYLIWAWFNFQSVRAECHYFYTSRRVSITDGLILINLITFIHFSDVMLHKLCFIHLCQHWKNSLWIKAKERTLEMTLLLISTMDREHAETAHSKLSNICQILIFTTTKKFSLWFRNNNVLRY